MGLSRRGAEGLQAKTPLEIGKCQVPFKKKVNLIKVYLTKNGDKTPNVQCVRVLVFTLKI